MFVQGGRCENIEDGSKLEVYDSENAIWKKFDSISRFRQSIWTLDLNIYTYGGFSL